MDISAIDYLSQQTFDEEVKRIFHGNWYAAGFASDIPGNNDFFLEKIGNKEVIVQNMGGQIRAFTNVCPHRFSAIHSECKGSRALVCPYHLWSFNAEGEARLPGTADAACLAASKDRLRLENWRTETVGNVIYICLNPAAPPLDEYLGPSRAWIEEVSLNCGYEFQSFESEIEANWKVVMNNTLEFYHAYSVHPKTFKPLIEAPLQKIRLLPSNLPNIHYAMPLKEADRTMERLDRMFARQFKRPEGIQMDSYEHLYSFPNLTIGHVNNRCFSFFKYQPVSPGKTKLTGRMWMPAPASGNLSSVRAICENYEPILRPFIHDIAEEDRGICETVQRGMQSRPAGWTTPFIDDETLVVRFQQAYARLMGS